MKACRILLTVLVGAMCCPAAAAAPAPYCDAADSAYEVADVFGRRLGRQPLTLPDWEGYMANPAISLSVRRGDNALDAVVASSDLALVHFDLPSEVGQSGATKTLDFSAGPAARLFTTVFPQRDKRRLQASLTIASSTAACVVKVDIIPVHAAPQSAPYPISVDFSQDKTGFFDDPRHRQIFQQAASDWAFFVDGKDAPLTEAGREITWIWEQTGFKKGRVLANAATFQGYLLYAYGISSELLRSGGAPSTLPVLFRQDGTPSRPRSGAVEIETAGNYNRLGWHDPAAIDHAWWRATNLIEEPGDLYSIMHHEIGHALFFHPRHPGFARAGTISASSLNGEQHALAIDATDHFPGVIDPASLRGVFGNEYHGRMPYGRWLTTRADLLAMAALGHPMRAVAALRPLAMDAVTPPPWRAGCPSQYQLGAAGGLPYYDWQLVDGQLPKGLALDRHTGVISGTPTAARKAQVVVQLRDHEMTAVRQTVSLEVTTSRRRCGL